jgi:hypothetical protein
VDTPGAVHAHPDPYAMEADKQAGKAATGDAAVVRVVSRAERLAQKKQARAHMAIRLPSYEQVRDDPVLYAHASRTFHLESNPGNARALVQAHGEGAARRDLWLNPPPLPLSTEEMDHVFGLPYARAPHPSYGDGEDSGLGDDPLLDQHHARLLRRLHLLLHHRARRPHHPEPLGVVDPARDRTDPRQDARLHRRHFRPRRADRQHVPHGLQGPENRVLLPPPVLRLSRHLREPEHRPRAADLALPQGAALPGIKKILVGSGLRYDLAVRSPEYVKELVTHHVGGYLKIAPEHTQEGPLSKMMKPGMGAYERFKQMFEKFSKEAGKEQYLIPYFIAAHPGTTDEDMLELALWLKRNGFRLDQVQTFLPTPLAIATAMWHTEKNPLRKVTAGSEQVAVVRGGRQRKLHKAFLRYHDAENWPLLREALKAMGRADLIGPGKRHLIPAWQPAGTGTASLPRTAGGGTGASPRAVPAPVRPGKVRHPPDATPTCRAIHSRAARAADRVRAITAQKSKPRHHAGFAGNREHG